MIRLIRGIDRIITTAVCIVLAAVAIYASYALWDNHQIYQSAEDVRSDMARLKPSSGTGGEKPSFKELLAVNPDVCAWVSLDGTKIDYPVLQGTNNLSYINTDVYGNFSISGSIFLDSRCSRDFTKPYALLYGHHMEKSAMFGDLDLYKEPGFFKEHKTGSLLLPTGSYPLKVFACMVVESSDGFVFEVDKWGQSLEEWFPYIKEHAENLDTEALDALMGKDLGLKNGTVENGPKVLAFSTCSQEFTDARTVLFAAVGEGSQ